MFRNLSSAIAILLVMAAPSYGDPAGAGCSSDFGSGDDGFVAGCGSCDAFGTGSWSSESPGSKYIEAIEKQIKKHWHPEGGENARPAIVSFLLGRNGKISQISLKQSSENMAQDQAALAAVRRSTPLPAIPPRLRDRYSVEVVFNIKGPDLSNVPRCIPSCNGGLCATVVVPLLGNPKIDWHAYANRLKTAVARNWHRDKNYTVGFTTLQFKLLGNGSIGDLQVHGRSSPKRLTENALKALKLASPLPSLPKHSPNAVLCCLDFSEFPEPAPVGKYANVTIQPDVDFGPYMAELQRKIKANVTWPSTQGNQIEHASIVFKVHKDGGISGLRLEKPSRNKALDAIAINSVERSAPFDHLPEGSSDDVDIQFHFDNIPDFAKQPRLNIALYMPYEYFSSSR